MCSSYRYTRYPLTSMFPQLSHSLPPLCVELSGRAKFPHSPARHVTRLFWLIQTLSYGLKPAAAAAR